MELGELVVVEGRDAVLIGRRNTVTENWSMGASGGVDVVHVMLTDTKEIRTYAASAVHSPIVTSQDW